MNNTYKLGLGGMKYMPPGLGAISIITNRSLSCR
jgi:hypothetical protein